MILNPFRSKSYYYKKGISEGFKEGYNEASSTYELKFVDQYNIFMEQMNTTKKQLDEYEKLLNEYDSEIDSLISKIERTEAENARLIELLNKERIIYKQNEELVRISLSQTPTILPVVSEGKLFWK